MLWLIYSLIGVLGPSAMAIGQQILKTEPIPMLFWLRLTSVILSALLLLFFNAPTSAIFYISSLAYGLLLVYLDIKYFTYVGQGGAAVAVRIGTATTIPSFFLWVAIDQPTQTLYLNHPLTSFLILLVILCAAFCMSYLRKCQVTTKAVKQLWPIIIHGTIGPIFSKLVIVNQPDPFGGILAYIAITSLVCLTVLGIFLIRKKEFFPKVIQNTRNRNSGFLLSLCSITAISAYNLAYHQVINPSYVAVIAMSTPFVITLYNQLTGHPDHSNKIAGFGLIGCAIALTILKQ